MYVFIMWHIHVHAIQDILTTSQQGKHLVSLSFKMTYLLQVGLQHHRQIKSMHFS